MLAGRPTTNTRCPCADTRPATRLMKAVAIRETSFRPVSHTGAGFDLLDRRLFMQHFDIATFGGSVATMMAKAKHRALPATDKAWKVIGPMVDSNGTGAFKKGTIVYTVFFDRTIK